MNIIEAAKLVEQGSKVRRKSWESDTVVERDNVVGIIKSNGKVFNLGEFLADDWEICEEQSAMEKAWIKIRDGRGFFGEDSLRVGRIFFEDVWNAAQKHFTEK